MEIIRHRKDLPTATLQQLNATYAALRGLPQHPGFDSRAVAEAQVSMAMLSSENAAGHLGVPKGQKPVVLTAQELAAAAENNPYAPGTMSHSLFEQISQQAPIQPRPTVRDRSPSEPKSSSKSVSVVRATFAGTSRTNPDSVRHAVLLFVQSAPEHTASIAALEQHFQQPVRGYVQKLMEKNHLVAVQGGSAK